MDSTIRLKQLNNPEISGYITEIIDGLISNSGTLANDNLLVFQTDLISGINSQFITYGENLSLIPQSIVCTILNNTNQFDYSFNIANITTSGFTINFSDYLDNSGYILNSVVSTLGFYSFNGSNNYVTTGETGNFVTQQELNDLNIQLTSYATNNFYPINNPSGLVIGTVVYTTGNQTIDNIKTIDNAAAIKFLPNAQIQDSSGSLVILPDANQLFQRGNINPVLNWKLLNLNDISGYVSIDWQNRQTWDNNSNLSIDYSNRILYGSWSGINAYFSGLFISGIPVLTGSANYYINTGQTGQFYSNNNPSGYITGISLTNYVQTGQTGSFITTLQTGQFVTINPNTMYITGNPSVVTLQDFESGIAVSFISGDENYIGIIDTNGNLSIDWNNRVLIDSSGNSNIDWNNKLLLFYDQIIFDWGNGIIYDNNIFYNGIKSIDTNNRLLINITNGDETAISLDWQNKILSGLWTGQSGVFVSGLTVGGNNVLTGIPNYYITTGQTGVFGQFANTGILSGVFYPLATNPSSYITTGQTGAFGTAVNTGILSGAFYPLNTNPDSYITSGQTGVFVTTNETGIFITTGQTGSFGGGGNTGILTGVFYPLNSNPNNYISSFTSSVNFHNSINWNSGTVFYVTLSGNVNFTFTGQQDGQVIVVSVSNTGNAWYSGQWPTGTTGILWPNLSVPLQSSGTSTDIYTFINITGQIYGNVVQGF